MSDTTFKCAQILTRIQSSAGLRAVEERNQRNRLRDMMFGTPLIADQRPELGPIIAIDCEMVGVGRIMGYRMRNGKRTPNYRSALARVSIVDHDGHVVLDTFVKPGETVKDYRTAVSGVRPRDLNSPNAMSLSDVRVLVIKILRDRVVVGHAVHNDLTVYLRQFSAVSANDFSFSLRMHFLARLRSSSAPKTRNLFGILNSAPK